MDGGFKDRRLGRDPDGVEGGSSSSFSTPRWRQSNTDPHGFIDHCSERKSRSGVSPVSTPPAKIGVKEAMKESGETSNPVEFETSVLQNSWTSPSTTSSSLLPMA